MQHRIMVPVLILLTLAPAAAAQQRRRPRGVGFGRGGFNAVVTLVVRDDVRQELQLTEEQRELLDALRADLFTQVQVIRNDSRPSETPDREGPDARRRRINAINKQGEELVMLVLEPEQAKRLKQLRLQYERTRAFDRPETAKALGLTESQLTQIRETRTEARAGGEDESFEQRRARQRQMESDILAVLSDAQRQRWKEMQGERFQFRSRRGNRFGRRRGPDEAPGNRD